MIGGPTDVVVETNLIRGTAAATREAPVARNGAAETLPRTAPPADPTPWPLQPEPVPLQQSVRNARAAADDIWDTPAEPAAAPAPPVPDVRPVRPADTLAGLADEIARPAAEITVTRGVAVQNGQGGQGAQVQQCAPRRRHCPPQPPSRRQIRPPIRASPRWRSVSKQPFAGRWRRRWSPKPSASPPPSMSKPLRRKAPPQPRRNRAISSKKWRAF